MRAVILVAVICHCLGLVWAQEAPGVGIGVELPSVGTLSVSATDVKFDLSGADYPPRSFPAYYYPVEPTQEMTLTVVANTTGWRLMATFPGLINEEANTMLGANQLEYSIDGSGWLSFEAVPVNIAISPGSTNAPLAAPQVHSLRLRLVITGNEVPGTYQGTVTFSLLAQ